jgi:hypothetical protein
MPGRGVPADPHPESLQEGRLSKPYRARLVKAGGLFCEWLARKGLTAEILASTPELMCQQLIAFIQDLFDNRFAQWWAVHTVLWAQTEFRALKSRLRPAWDSVLSWRLRVPVHSRTPLPEPLLKVFTIFGCMAALALDRPNADLWWRFSALLGFGFHGLFRPHELLTLTRADLKLPTPWLGHLANPVAVGLIKMPKNRAFGGRQQVRIVRCARTIEWLSWLARDFAPDEPLWPYTDYRFRCCFAEAGAFFGFPGGTLTPASLRAGGATAMLENNHPVSSIRFAGGWVSEKSMAAYLQQAESAAVLLSLSRSQTIKIQACLAAFSYAEFPPPRPFRFLAAGWTLSEPKQPSPQRGC